MYYPEEDMLSMFIAWEFYTIKPQEQQNAKKRQSLLGIMPQFPPSKK